MKVREVHKRTARINEPCEDNVGEMEEKDLRSTCMDLENQRAVRITTKDIKEARARLADWHSKKEASRDFRRNFMLNYIPDIQDIST